MIQLIEDIKSWLTQIGWIEAENEATKLCFESPHHCGVYVSLFLTEDEGKYFVKIDLIHEHSEPFITRLVNYLRIESVEEIQWIFERQGHLHLSNTKDMVS